MSLPSASLLLLCLLVPLLLVVAEENEIEIASEVPQDVNESGADSGGSTEQDQPAAALDAQSSEGGSGGSAERAVLYAPPPPPAKNALRVNGVDVVEFEPKQAAAETSSTAPPTTASPSCADYAENCAPNVDYCQEVNYRPLMKQYCAKACGYCSSEEGEEEEDTKSVGTSVDADADASARHYDAHAERAGRHHRFIRHRPDTADAVVVPPTAAAADESATAACEDASPRCVSWEAHNFCASTFFHFDIKKKFCSKTCRICSEQPAPSGELTRAEGTERESERESDRVERPEDYRIIIQNSPTGAAAAEGEHKMTAEEMKEMKSEPKAENAEAATPKAAGDVEEAVKPIEETKPLEETKADEVKPLEETKADEVKPLEEAKATEETEKPTEEVAGVAPLEEKPILT